MFLLISLAACGSTEIVTQPVPVEVEVVRYIAVPSEHLVERAPSTIPERPTYADIITLFAADRASIVTLNAQLRAIRELSDGGQ